MTDTPEMVGAAPTGLGVIGVGLLAGALALAASGAGAPNTAARLGTGDSSAHPKAATSQLWGVEIDAASLSLLKRSSLARLRKAGINALILDPHKLTRARLIQARGSARRAGLIAVVVMPSSRTTKTRAGRYVLAACRSARRAGLRCAIQARTASSALALARRRRSGDLVVARLSGPKRLSSLRSASARGLRVLGLPRLTARPAFADKSWESGIALATSSNALDLAVSPTGPTRYRALNAYLALLAKNTALPGGGTLDTTPPTVPVVSVTNVSAGSVTVSWLPSADNTGVVSYGLYRNSVRVGSANSSPATFTGLACGTTYSLGVDAVDTAANRSTPGTVQPRTSNCAGGGDTTPPSTPTGLHSTSSTQTSISISWNASSDDVGVAGYTLLVDGSVVRITQGLSETPTGLDCGTTYSIAVDAFDAAGNHSARATTSASTAACDGGPPAGNVFVASNGSDSGSSCVRFATSQQFPTNRSTVCASLGKAYALAQPGDAVVIGNGSYTGDQRLCRGGGFPGCSASASEKGPPAIVFRAESRHGPVFHSVIYLGSSNGSNPPSFITLDGIDQEGQIRAFFASNRPKATNITIRNGHIWQVRTWEEAALPLIQNAQIDNFTISNQEVGPACCSGDLIQGGVANANVPVNMIVKDSVMHDIYDDCAYVPAAVNAQYGPCNNPGDGTHVDGIHMWGGVDGLHLLRNRWYAIGANGDEIGQTIFLESDATGVCAFFRDIEIVSNAVYAGATNNNAVSMGLSGGSVGCSPGLGNGGYIRIVYNTIWADQAQSNGAGGNLSVGGVDATTANTGQVVIAGNIIRNFSYHGAGDCGATLKGGGTFLPVYRNNQYANPGGWTGVCHASDHHGTPTFVRHDSLDPDQHLVQNGQWAINHGESMYCPAVDIAGVARPVGAACDAGAYEGP